MKTLKLKSTVMTTLMVVAVVGSSFALDGNRQSNNSHFEGCTTRIGGLTSAQTEAITKLEAGHQLKMDALRKERRSVVDERSKAEIRIKMLDQRDAHRDEVKKVLSPDQQAAYDLLPVNGNNARFARNGNPNKSSHFKGQRERGNGYGYGRGYSNNCLR